MASVKLNVNQSKSKMFRRCQKQYSFRYDTARFYPELSKGKKRLELVPKQRRLPLYRGSWMHALQESLHHQWAGFDKWEQQFGEAKNKLVFETSNWRETHEVLTDAFNSMFDEEKEDLGDLPTEAERMFKSYLRFWKQDQDTYSVAELPNGKPAIEFLVEVPLDDLGLPGVNFKGRIDLMVEDDEYEGVWIWDAKWVKSIPEPTERMMSPQSPLYVWAVRRMLDLDVQGFVYNYGRTKPPTVPKVLKRPEGMLSLASNMDTDYATYLATIKENHGEDWRNYLSYYRDKLRDLKGRDALWFSRDRIPVGDDQILRAVREYTTTAQNILDREKRREYIPRSYFYNCKFGCEFHTLCAAEFGGLEIEPLIKNGYMFEGERYGKEDLLSG